MSGYGSTLELHKYTEFHHFYQNLHNYNISMEIYGNVMAITKQGLVSQVTRLCRAM
jgi:hypothetical protein